MTEPVNEPLIEITDPGSDRYATLKLIEWWDQRRLAAARVMVVGAGALGNEALKNLALLGVGHLLIADFDTVEAANLSRSVLFRAADAGQRKVDIAAARVRELNPDIRVTTFHGDITRDLGAGIYRRVDVVLGCLDNRAARLAVNRACWKVGTPWIDGAIDVLMGMVKVFDPNADGTACYECSMTEQDYALLNVRYSCPATREDEMIGGRLLTTPTSASIVAAWQVQEAVKLLHGLPVPAGKAIYYNGQRYSTELMTLAPREDCFSHIRLNAIRELPAIGADSTVGDLLAPFGPGSALLLETELVARFFCPGCGAEEAVYRPYDQVMPYQVACPACGTNRLPNAVGRIAHGTPGTAATLRQVGVPPLHIVQIATPGGPVFAELSRDQEALIDGWQPRRAAITD